MRRRPPSLPRVHPKGECSGLRAAQLVDSFAHRAGQLIDGRIAGDPPFWQKNRRGERSESKVGGRKAIFGQVLAAVRQQIVDLGEDSAHLQEGALRTVGCDAQAGPCE